MDQIEKFIRKLNAKMALRLISVLKKVISLDLKEYQEEKLKGFSDLYRIRVGKIRIVYKKQSSKGVPMVFEYRDKVYKRLRG